MRSISFLIVFLLAGCSGLPSRGQTLADVFARVESSVVTVLTESRQLEPGQAGLTAVGGVGSGVLISEDGRVMTAAHVVHTADSVLVVFADGRKLRARVLGSDRLNDVALLQLESRAPVGVHVAELGNSDRNRVGEPVFVVGAPQGISHTLTVGHISARRKPDRSVQALFETELFQTDASINPGNSGGPMFDLHGRVIGIVSHIISESGGSEGLGFAVTSNVAKALLLDVPPFWGGVDGILLHGEVAKILNLPGGRPGILVQYVARNSPAERLGLRGGEHQLEIDGVTLVAGGDILLEVAGVPVTGPDTIGEMQVKLRSLPVGHDLDLIVLRGGEIRKLSGKLER